MPAHHNDHVPPPAGIDEFTADAVLPRHRHRHGYASVVLSGKFTEASFSGLMPAEPGDVLLHGRFDCHCDYGQGGARKIQLLRLEWIHDDIEGHFRIGDPDELVRIAERDPKAAMETLACNMRPAPATNPHWTHGLSTALRREEPLSLQDWAARAGVRPEALSRGFRRYFGASPKRYRLEARSRRAWQEIVRSRRTLTAIAHEFGFADLAHLSRSIRAFTGAPPSAWRASVKTGQTD
ncbi:MAG TPA: helix-turn-helix transcriptional regulator [Caulobacteraceae bacterium]|nr:helix-turn-helix transcriptional regulator [Caulobacteraceae bacterium]